MTDGSISSPAYGSNGGLTGEALVRFCFTFVAALVLGTIFWQVGTKSFNNRLWRVIVEIPYKFVQTTYYSLVVYAMVSFEWALSKFISFFFITFFSFLYFTYCGIMTVSITPNHHAAAIIASAFYALFTLFYQLRDKMGTPLRLVMSLYHKCRINFGLIQAYVDCPAHVGSIRNTYL
ncbi:hypothetical protein QYF36_024611 [Acer negundo]|nr:hypothetical protein QYF36_024611 [Acer negundo]